MPPDPTSGIHAQLLQVRPLLSCLLGVSMCRGNMPCTYIGMVKDRGVQTLKHKARVTKCVCEEQPLTSTKMAWH